MDSLDTFLAIIERYGVSIAFAIYCAAEVRIMRQQMIKTEVAYSAQLQALNKEMADLIKEYTGMVRDYTDVARALKDQVHELKNVIQRGIFEESRGRRMHEHDER